MTVSTKLAASVAVTMSEVIDLGERSANVARKFVASLASGTAVGMADRVFMDTRTLGPSATESLDLNGATLFDPFGVAFSIVKVKAILIASADANINDILVGAAATAWAALLGATGTILLRPGASFSAFAGVADAAGYAVAGGATDLLKILNNAGTNSVTYDIAIVGTSA
jgi:threonine dehydrogenase-like Zn-dependent dehydrogenase